MNSNNIEINESENGFLTLSTKDFLKEELIISIKGAETLVRDKFTIQVEPEIHISPLKFSGKYINHSCAPNTRVSNRKFIALRDISIGEEITFDYNSTEDEIAEAFDCLCANDNCRVRIQ